jgi:hypothetical protein
MSGHSRCCKGRKTPKTRAQFAALNYPSNPSGHSDNHNRIHNPERVPVRYQKPIHKKYRKGWWFRLKGDAGPVLLDGSGDGVARGQVVSCKGIDPATKGDRLVCLNASNLKVLRLPDGTKKLCGFTWNVGLVKQQAVDGQGEPIKKSPPPCSGWIPLSALEFKSKKTRPKVLAALKSWACCLAKYAKWGRARTSKKSQRYRFRTVAELESELARLVANADARKRYFGPKNAGVKKLLKKANGSRDALGKLIGILPFCKDGNKLTDYLPKGVDYKGGFYDAGYTNLNANVSIGDERPRMAPIALDVLPAGHVFHRLPFRDKKPVLGFIYRVPKKNPGKKVGRVVWYYGYCDVVGPDPQKKQRRYGWVPALALKKG